MAARPELLIKDDGMRRLLWPLALGLLSLAAGCLGNPFDLWRPSAGVESAPTDAATRRLQLITKVQKKGGSIRLDSDDPDKPVIGANLPGFRDFRAILDTLAPLPKLRDLNVYNTDFTDADLERLSGLNNLQTLNLSATLITDAGLACLPSLPNLRVLYLTDTAITDAGLRYVAALPNLTDLSLLNTRVTDEGLVQLRGLKNLQKLVLGSSAITDRGLISLRAWPTLRELHLLSTHVTDSGVEQLKVSSPQLKILR
jgi:hypothetical protein